MATTTIILGGGVGGLTAANELRRLSGPEHRVVLIERQAEFLFAPSLLWAMVGARRTDRLARPLGDLLRPGVELVQGTVGRIDPERKLVVADGRELPYDALVVALGAALAPEALPGYVGAAHDFFEPAGAASFWAALQAFEGGRIVVAVAALPYKCPAAPYEAALLIEDALRRRHVRQRAEVMLVTPEPQPMPVAGPALGAAVTSLLEARGIVFHRNRPLAAIDPAGRELVFADGTRERFDLLAAVPPHRPPEAVRASSLANESGWIPVDSGTLRARADDAYAIGDVAAVALANGKLLPKAGVFAHAEALVVARRIAAERDGSAAPVFDGLGYCWVETGGGRAAFAAGDFYAEPSPRIDLRAPGAAWHLGKVLFERTWLGGGPERRLASAALQLGARAMGIGPVRM